MAASTEAQEEFDALVSKASASERMHHHPSDADDYEHDKDHSDQDEEDIYNQSRINENMRLPVPNTDVGLRLPHRDFDSGRTTGVKGVIADARSFEEARRNGWASWRNIPSERSNREKRLSSVTFLKDDGEGSASEDEAFVERWRQSRRDELAREGNDIRNRRTSPSVRRYGKFDEVDAMGYLDAIEKVGRDTVVVIFVYDPESVVSQVIQEAIEPLVSANPTIHFARVHYEDVEFDPAGVPAILGYKNQGDLFANLTYIIGQIPDDTVFDTPALVEIFKKHNIF